MRKSCHEQNNKLLQAYTLYRQNNLAQSLQLYQQILTNTRSPQLRQNLLTTLSIISISMGNYNYALELLEEPVYGYGLGETEGQGQGEGGMYFVRLRYWANLCFLHTVVGMYGEAVEDWRRLREVLGDGCGDVTEGLAFVFRLFFRVDSLEDLCQPVEIPADASLAEAYYMLNLAIAKQLINLQGSQPLLKAAYPIFLTHSRPQLALVALRQLLLQPLNNKETTKYQKELSKIMAMEEMACYQVDNFQAMECCKMIAGELVGFAREVGMGEKGKGREREKEGKGLWELVLKYEGRKVMGNSGVAEEERLAISKNIQMMLREESGLVISEMKKTDFYRAAEREIKNVIFCFVRVCQSVANLQRKAFFQKVVAFGGQKSANNRSILRNRSHTQLDSKRSEKENRMPLTLVRQKSSKSLLNEEKKQTSMKAQIRPLSIQYPKHIYKMIKFCEYGSFLSKRNFNSDGGEYRFVRSTHSILKWAKNPQKIEQSCQLYPLKDISAIVYGKCTPTMLKQSNTLLKEEYCFSLKLQKRTLDFYCKDFEQVSGWVCGLSVKLRQVNSGVRGYSLGRMLWKRMFMILRENFTAKIKSHQRKFYYETAQAVILFGKNNYKLPATQK